MSELSTETRPCTFTVVRVHGVQHLRAEKSWRPIVSVNVGDHQCHELNLGCDGQNPNLKQCFQLRNLDSSSQIDICVYHKAPSKKKNKKRNLVASACCTVRELARLQAQQQCRQKSVEIKLNGISRPKGRSSNGKSSPVLLVAKLELPLVSSVEPVLIQEDADARSDILSGDTEDGECLSSPTESSEALSFVWPETHDPEPKVHTGYWSNSEDDSERDPLLRRPNDDLLVSKHSDGKDGHLIRREQTLWFAASILPSYTETISIQVPCEISTIDAIVDAFSPYRELREARVDSDYERVLNHLCAEWRFVGASLVALAGLGAGVFGFSSASLFTISLFSRRAIAIGSVASGIGLSIVVWFLLAYSNVGPVKFQKMALDVYGKYLFFCISARIPALCMFTSALALMTFLLSVAWSAWPTAVLVMSFVAGVLISLQFIVYGLHCIVVVVVDAVRSVRRSVLRLLARVSGPPPPDVREKHADTSEK